MYNIWLTMTNSQKDHSGIMWNGWFVGLTRSKEIGKLYRANKGESGSMITSVIKPDVDPVNPVPWLKHS